MSGGSVSLSGAYAVAQGLVDDFSLSGLPHLDPAGPPPSFGFAPSQTAPPPPWAAEFEAAVKTRKRRLASLVRRREAFRVVVEKLHAHDATWRQDLDEWARLSQAAQTGALAAGASLLIGVPGHVRANPKALRTFTGSYERAMSQLRAGLPRLRALLAGIAPSDPHAQAAARALDELLASLDRRLADVRDAERLLETVEKIGDKLLDAIKLVELSAELETKHDLTLVAKTIEDFLTDVLKDAALDATASALTASGLAAAGHAVPLADFLFDYAYNSARFYVAWGNVNEILARVDDQVELERVFSERIVATANQIRETRAELAKLAAARESGVAVEELLDDLRHQELHHAHLQGGWFSQRTGFAAPGHPLSVPE